MVWPLAPTSAAGPELAAMVAAQAATIARQAAGITALEATVAAQAEVIAAQAARIAELEARLATTSRTSSKPPSSDGYAKPTRSRRERSGRRPGKQPGAPGAHLARVGEPDEVVVHAPERCQACGADLADAPVVGVEARQVFDLPPMRLVATEHRGERRRCACGQVTVGAFPGAVRAPAQYGPGVRALVAYLCCHQHLPYDRCAQLLADCLGAPVAAGSLATMVAECAGGLDGVLATIREQLKAASVVHVDETGARVAGRLHWVHSASTDELTLYTVHAKRGVAAMDAAGVLPGFAGVAVHDGWAPYWRYDAATHALCNAHHLRELDAVAETPGQGWAAGMAELLVDAKRAVQRAVDAGADCLEPAVAARLRQRYDRLLADGHRANPPQGPALRRRGRAPRSKAANLLARLDARRDQVLRFVTDFRVPFDNNLAERDLRMVKLHEKISGCWRSAAGAEAFLAVRGYISTARKQRVGVLGTLRRVVEGNPWVPAAAGSCAHRAGALVAHTGGP